MGKIVEKKKKKKGRPSLLDLQKRNLKEQQEEQKRQQQLQKKRNHNNSAPHSRDNYRIATPVRRSARRNPSAGEESPEKPEEDDEDDDLDGKRREKKLKLVLRLPPNKKSPANSALENSDGSDSDDGEAEAGVSVNKKRKIDGIADGSGRKGDESISGATQSNTFQGATNFDSGPSTPLPDKKLLLFVLERLQKKDTYGVFSEPVDPEELPDYHDVIEHPMDFATVRKKLTGGAYASLEQFEKDIFLICSNAMQYNAPETIYFRQARSIHELAKKNFENLRQDSDDNEPETKIVRRGRPPTKNLKKPIGRPSLEGAGSEFSSDAAPATVGENATLVPNHDMRKGPLLSDKSGLAESSGRLNALRTNDLYASWLADNKYDRSDEFTGSMMRGYAKLGKKQVVHEESRRNTYMQSLPSAGAHEPSVLMTFDGERKQLMPVGVLVEHGYARSLARFAANLGPVVWNVAVKKIERSLPDGVKFGPGWVGENDIPQRKMPLLLAQLSAQPSQSLPDLANPHHIENSCMSTKVDKLSEKPVDESADKHMPCNSASTSDGRPSKSLPVSATTSSAPIFTNKSPEPVRPKAETFEGLKPHPGFNMRNSSTAGVRPRPPFLAHQGPMIHPGMNGYNGFNLAAQMGKLAASVTPSGSSNPTSQVLDTSSRDNSNSFHQPTANSLQLEDPNKILQKRNPVNAGNSLSIQGNEAPASPPGLHPRSSWKSLSPQPRPGSNLSPQQKPDSVPPDLNVRFQSPGSGSPSSSKVDSVQPDLALQL